MNVALSATEKEKWSIRRGNIHRRRRACSGNSPLSIGHSSNSRLHSFHCHPRVDALLGECLRSAGTHRASNWCSSRGSRRATSRRGVASRTLRLTRRSRLPSDHRRFLCRSVVQSCDTSNESVLLLSLHSDQLTAGFLTEDVRLFEVNRSCKDLQAVTALAVLM